MNHSNVLYVVLLPLLLFITTNSHTAADTYSAMLPATIAPQFFAQQYAKEGFAAGTLVRVQNGFKPIEAITNQDMVFGEHLELKRVLKTAQRIVQQYIRLTIGDDTIHTGPDQIVRTAWGNPLWQHVGTAHQQQEFLLGFLAYCGTIDQYEVVSKPTVLYQLEVEDHTFCIGSRALIVHNADIATISTAMLCLEYVAYAHPVIALVGSTIALSTIARQAYKAWQASRQHGDTNDTTDEVVPQEVFLAERYYYEQRQKALTTLRDGFAGIYRGIIAMKELFYSNLTTFSSQFLQHTVQQHTVPNVLRISITDELKLSDDRKALLRKAREQELALLEKEISALHTALVVHFNELVSLMYNAIGTYNAMQSEMQQANDIWNANKHALTDQIASQAFESDLKEECVLNEIKQRASELKLVGTYYKRNTTAALKESTNIIALLDSALQFVAETEQWVGERVHMVAANTCLCEQYFARRAIPTTLFTNQIKNAFYKEQSNKNTQSLKKAKETQTDMCAAGGPNDPKKPKDDDDKDDEKVKTADMPENEGILGHIFRNEEGHLPRTPENYKLIRGLVRDAKNYLGPDMRGNHWWGKILENGKQLWAQAYKGIVRNGGLNDAPRPYNPKTGLSKLM